MNYLARIAIEAAEVVEAIHARADTEGRPRHSPQEVQLQDGTRACVRCLQPMGRPELGYCPGHAEPIDREALARSTAAFRSFMTTPVADEQPSLWVVPMNRIESQRAAAASRHEPVSATS